ncbi:hypothetical protein CcaverHIS002_0310660 [Cutaneotrichosporon cavernicola]|nr:hypothetical protein CcaverHIS002_0310660 [Cutaneotrichosporon cavernicola]
MTGLPRRSNSSANSSTTTTTHATRKGTLSNAPRTATNSISLETLEAMSAVESLRSPPIKGPDYGSLGLRLHSRNASEVSNTRPTPPTSPVTYSTTSLLQRQKRLSITSLPSPTEPLEPPSPAEHRRMSDRMVRKKSGEMVKPALKNRSMSTPDFSRGESQDLSGKSQSSHNLWERTKSVRFDDGELESVVLFLRSQRPNAVAKAVDGGYSPVDGDDEHEKDLSDYVHFRTRRSGGARGSNGGDQTDFQIDTCSAVPRVRLDFGPGTQGILKDEYVVLERIEMCQPLGLRGSVLVRNIAFEKWVGVRFTLDGWQTISEVSASHASNIPPGTTGDEGWDRFCFNIKLEDYRRKLEDREFHLCVRYNSNGGEWWDSNGGQNYRITFKHQVALRQRPTSQFWSGSLTHGATTVATTTLPRRRQPGHRHWTFPQSEMPIARPDSPALSPPPQGAFRPPSAPDVHSYLRLKKYCAPSPPQSPPTKLPPAAGLEPILLSLAPEHARAAPPPPMTLVHGRPATTWIPTGLAANDEDVFATSESSSEAGDLGDITPTVARARSPETQPILEGSPFVASPVTSPVTARTARAARPQDKGGAKIQRNTSVSGDLQSMASVDSSVGLMTPPSSNLSSPPLHTTLLPPESPTTSMSTGDSSPVNTLISTTPDEVDGRDHDGRTLNAASYQEFIDKFCFFKSPPSASRTLEDEYGGSYFPPITGSSYYNSFSMGSTTPPGAMTPTFDTFNMARATTPTNASITSASGSTPRESPSRSPTAATYPLPWTPGEESAPSVAAA